MRGVGGDHARRVGALSDITVTIGGDDGQGSGTQHARSRRTARRRERGTVVTRWHVSAVKDRGDDTPGTVYAREGEEWHGQGGIPYTPHGTPSVPREWPNSAGSGGVETSCESSSWSPRDSPVQPANGLTMRFVGCHTPQNKRGYPRGHTPLRGWGQALATFTHHFSKPGHPLDPCGTVGGVRGGPAGGLRA